jgi:outer membrane protein TolC
MVCILKQYMQLLTLIIFAFSLFVLQLSSLAAQETSAKEKAPSLPSLPVSGSPVLLSDCIREAMENNAKILIAKQNIERAKGGIISARSKLYPSINNTTTLSMENVDLFKQEQSNQGGVIGFHHDWRDVIDIRYSIFSAGVNERQIEIAGIEDEIAWLQLHEAVNNVIYDIQSTFYKILVNQSEIEVHKKTIQLLRQELERQKSLFEAGRATRFNIIRTEVRLTNELPDLEMAQTSMRDSIVRLYELMGTRPSAGESLDSFRASGQLNCPPVTLDVEHWIVEALGRSPELSRQEKQVIIEKRKMEISKAALIPRLDLFAATRLRQKEAEGSFFDATPQTTLGVMGTWNIFDGFEARGKTRQAEAQVKREKVLMNAIVQRIELDVRRAILNLQQAEKSLQSQKGNIEKATEAIRLAQSSVEAGMATQFDILQATVDLSSAQNVELRTRQQYHQALAELEKVTFARVCSGATASPSSTTPFAAPDKIPPLRLSTPTSLRNEPTSENRP